MEIEFFRNYLRYKLGLEVDFHFPAKNDSIRTWGFKKIGIDDYRLPTREELKIKVEDSIKENKGLRNEKIANKDIKEYLVFMVENLLKAWNNLSHEESKLIFIESVKNMGILDSITLVSKNRMKLEKKYGIYRDEKILNILKNGVIGGYLNSNNIFIPTHTHIEEELTQEWEKAQKVKPITTKKYLDLLGFTRTKPSHHKEIYLCLDTIENCQNALLNDANFSKMEKKFENRFDFSPECKHQEPLVYYKKNLARDVLMHELGHVFGIQKDKKKLSKENENEAQMWSSIFLRSEKSSMFIEFLSYFQRPEYCLEKKRLLFIDGNNEDITIGA